MSFVDYFFSVLLLLLLLLLLFIIIISSFFCVVRSTVVMKMHENENNNEKTENELVSLRDRNSQYANDMMICLFFSLSLSLSLFAYLNVQTLKKKALEL